MYYLDAGRLVLGWVATRRLVVGCVAGSGAVLGGLLGFAPRLVQLGERSVCDLQAAIVCVGIGTKTVTASIEVSSASSNFLSATRHPPRYACDSARLWAAVPAGCCSKIEMASRNSGSASACRPRLRIRLPRFETAKPTVACVLPSTLRLIASDSR